MHFTHKQGSTEYLFVSLPNEAVEVEYFDKESLPTALLIYTEHDFFEPGLPNPYPLPQGDYELIYSGLLADVTEDIAVEMIEFNTNTNYYMAYNSDMGFIWNTAKESLESLFRSKRWMLENEYGIIEPELNTVCCGNWVDNPNMPNIAQCCSVPIPSEESVYLLQQWQESQSRVLTKLAILKIK